MTEKEVFAKLTFSLVGEGAGKPKRQTEPEIARADVHPRPPKRDAKSTFWKASVASRNCAKKSIYVWATNKAYYYGYTVPEDAAIVAEFFRDKMVFCIWGDSQNER